VAVDEEVDPEQRLDDVQREEKCPRKAVEDGEQCDAIDHPGGQAALAAHITASFASPVTPHLQHDVPTHDSKGNGEPKEGRRSRVGVTKSESDRRCRGSRLIS